MIAQNSIADFALKLILKPPDDKQNVGPVINGGKDTAVHETTQNEEQQSPTIKKSFKELMIKVLQDSRQESGARKVSCFKDVAGLMRDARKIQAAEDKTSMTENFQLANDAIVCLALVLSMKPEDLVKVLSSIEIKAEDLLDCEKRATTLDRLSMLLNLDNGKKETLSEVIGMIAGKLCEKAGMAKTMESKPEAMESSAFQKNDLLGDKTWIQVDGAKAKIVRTDGTAALFKELREKISELVFKYRQNPQLIKDETAQIIERAMLLTETQEPIENLKLGENAENSTGQAYDNGRDEKNAGVKGQIPEKAETEDLAQVKAKAGKESGEVLIDESKTEDVLNSVISKAKAERGNAVQLNSIGGIQPNEAVGEAFNSYKGLEQHGFITRDEILYQVVEKAKVILTEGKSEIVVDLKPDFLGKLSLKIVTEQGMVMAKFTAENQQVKAILETNMQMLKDALEKQGLAVQAFSVSVGQDSFGGFDRNQNGRTFVSLSNVKGTIARIILNEIRSDSEATRDFIGPYRWSESRIDLTA